MYYPNWLEFKKNDRVIIAIPFYKRIGYYLATGDYRPLYFHKEGRILGWHDSYAAYRVMINNEEWLVVPENLREKN